MYLLPFKLPLHFNTLMLYFPIIRYVSKLLLTLPASSLDKVIRFKTPALQLVFSFLEQKRIVWNCILGYDEWSLLSIAEYLFVKINNYPPILQSITALWNNALHLPWTQEVENSHNWSYIVGKHLPYKLRYSVKCFSRQLWNFTSGWWYYLLQVTVLIKTLDNIIFIFIITNRLWICLSSLFFYLPYCYFSIPAWITL
jgi:hypothetical protein